MDSKELKGLCEAYTAVYDEELRDELEEMADEFAGIEDLTDEEIDAIVEETIDEMLDEGYEFDEVEEIFEEVLSEAKVTMGRGGETGSGKITTGSGSRIAAASRLSATKQRKRQEKIAKVKGAVKSALGKAKAAVKSGVAKAKEAGKEAKFRAVDKPVAAYATKRNLHPAAGMAARSKDPAKRRGLRAKVAADIKGRIKQKIAKAQVGAYSAARKAGQAASDVAGRAKQSAKYTAARTKRGVKRAIGAAASGVASGASKVAARMATEEMDVYDVVLNHLIENGYAETPEAAEKIMVNMSEEWRESIVEDIRGAITYNPNTPIGKLKRRIKGSTPEKREARTREYQGNKSDSAERFGGSQRAPYDDNRGDIPALRGR